MHGLHAQKVALQVAEAVVLQVAEAVVLQVAEQAQAADQAVDGTAPVRATDRPHHGTSCL
jgi:hypothetical protein